MSQPDAWAPRTCPRCGEERIRAEFTACPECLGHPKRCLACEGDGTPTAVDRRGEEHEVTCPECYGSAWECDACGGTGLAEVCRYCEREQATPMLLEVA